MMRGRGEEGRYLRGGVDLGSSAPTQVGPPVDCGGWRSSAGNREVRIAILAWGSLVWSRGSLAVTADFEALGPRLPIEFCRVSGDGRLTLVIDENVGAFCTTYAAVSSFDDLSATIENLRIREGMPGPKGVGYVNLRSGKQSSVAVEKHPRAVGTIHAWTISNSYDATIWTALANNFHKSDKANEPFSIEAAIRYLNARGAETLTSSLEYVRNAPPEVQTPVREAIHRSWPERR
jgi:hypothetical protein